MTKVKDIAQAIRYRGRTTKLRLPLVWLRHKLAVRPNDVFLASYPRCGNTWGRFLLSEILTKREAEFESVASIIPTLRLRSHSRIPSLLPSGGRLLRTHERYHKEYQKAVYFVRDPRDVVISNYEFEKGNNRFAPSSFEDFVVAFVRGKVNSFGNWSQHVRGWLDSPLAATDDFLLVRYEEMRSNTEGVVANIVKFLGIQVDSEAIRKAVANNDLQRMRQKEDHYHLRPGDAAGRQVRIGSVGGWRQRLSSAHVDLIEHHAGDLLERLGYRQHEVGTALRDCRADHLSSAVPLERDSRSA
jgi:estrone sulfotransferase